MKKDNMGYIHIEAHTPYVEGVIGQSIDLTFRQRLAILFSKGITVFLISEKFNK